MKFAVQCVPFIPAASLIDSRICVVQIDEIIINGLNIWGDCIYW